MRLSMSDFLACAIVDRGIFLFDAYPLGLAQHLNPIWIAISSDDAQYFPTRAERK
jgi:hypothetical protein